MTDRIADLLVDPNKNLNKHETKPETNQTFWEKSKNYFTEKIYSVREKASRLADQIPRPVDTRTHNDRIVQKIDAQINPEKQLLSVAPYAQALTNIVKNPKILAPLLNFAAPMMASAATLQPDFSQLSRPQQSSIEHVQTVNYNDAIYNKNQDLEIGTQVKMPDGSVYTIAGSKKVSTGEVEFNREQTLAGLEKSARESLDQNMQLPNAQTAETNYAVINSGPEYQNQFTPATSKYEIYKQAHLSPSFTIDTEGNVVQNNETKQLTQEVIATPLVTHQQNLDPRLEVEIASVFSPLESEGDFIDLQEKNGSIILADSKTDRIQHSIAIITNYLYKNYISLDTEFKLSQKPLHQTKALQEMGVIHRHGNRWVLDKQKAYTLYADSTYHSESNSMLKSLLDIKVQEQNELQKRYERYFAIPLDKALEMAEKVGLSQEEFARMLGWITATRYTEGTFDSSMESNSHNVSFGGGVYEGYGTHPGTFNPHINQQIQADTGWGNLTDATGDFQFMSDTWNTAARQAVKIFGPESIKVLTINDQTHNDLGEEYFSFKKEDQATAMFAFLVERGIVSQLKAGVGNVAGMEQVFSPWSSVPNSDLNESNPNTASYHARRLGYTRDILQIVKGLNNSHAEIAKITQALNSQNTNVALAR
jgi:muramidase (phage lysozyme)